jgi:hypothetical protein
MERGQSDPTKILDRKDLAFVCRLQKSSLSNCFYLFIFGPIPSVSNLLVFFCDQCSTAIPSLFTNAATVISFGPLLGFSAPATGHVALRTIALISTPDLQSVYPPLFF